MRHALRAYLSLGSNLGERLNQLVHATQTLVERGRARRDGMPALTLAAVSPVYETAPLGADGAIVTDQPAFLNCAIAVDTLLDPRELRMLTAATERAHGRTSAERWTARAIDIDLVLFGSDRIETAALIVPHPRMAERAFVLRPLVDIDPAIAAPGIGPLAPLLGGVAWQGCEVHTTAEDFAWLIGRPT